MAKDDLISLKDRTTSEQQRIARKGGIASGKARREKKAMRETLEILLTMSLKGGKAADIESIQNLAAVKGKNISVQEAIMLAQIQKAMRGDTRAAEFVRDSSGNKPNDNIVLGGEVNNPMAGLTTEELKKLVNSE